MYIGLHFIDPIFIYKVNLIIVGSEKYGSFQAQYGSPDFGTKYGKLPVDTRDLASFQHVENQVWKLRYAALHR